MPQDSLRSVVYRSFVTCDDPKGVAECGTIRKSKCGSEKMKVESKKMPKNLNMSSYKKKEMDCNGSTEELNNPSSFHLKEVSRGAQKLNQVIDSWSETWMSFDGRSKDIAKDLLEGSLSLQDSLIMFGKLQEASEYVAKLKKKQKEKVRRVGDGELGIERSKSVRFEDHIYDKGFQKPRRSVDGVSRDCYEELRKVIRDSLTRHNLLPHSSYKEKVHIDRRKLDLFPDIPSTSSSQSSVFYSYDSASSDSFLSSKVQQEKQRGPSLIAKLMGLQEFPSKPLESTPQKQLERDKIFRQSSPIFDIDLPKATKSQFGVQKVNQEWRTLEEIIETMQQKGLLKNNNYQSYPSDNTDLEKRFADDAPPIVVIKPLHSQCSEEEEICTCRFIQEEKDLHNAQAVSRKWKTGDKFQPKSINRVQGALNSDNMWRKMQVEETPIKRFIQEKGVQDSKETLEKPEGREAKNNLKLPSSKKKASVPADSKPLKKEVIEKKVDKIEQATPSRRKPVEMEKVKSKSHDQSKVTPKKLRKPENGFEISKDQIPQQKSAISDPVLRYTVPAISHNSCDWRKTRGNEIPVSKHVPENVENRGNKADDRQTDLSCNKEFGITDTAVEVELLAEEGTDACEIPIEESFNNSQNLPSEAALLPPLRDLKTSNGATIEPDHCIYHNKTGRECCTMNSNTKDLILRSPSFLSRVEKLFNTKACLCPVLQTNSLHDSETINTKLLLDCVNELLEGRNLNPKPIVHPLLQSLVKSSRIFISLHQLVEEVCDGIEDLKSYSKLPNKSGPVDTLHAVLDRDLWCKGFMSGAWDMGWSNGFSVDEIDQVVVDLEKLILSALIEDLLTDFVL